jgi:hypothetical protein
MATVTHLDPIRTSDHIIATNLCLKLASPLFYAAMAAQVTGANDGTFEAWWVLRLMAEKFQAKQAITLDENELHSLGRALRIAHATAHSVLPPPAKQTGGCANPLDCPCSIAETIRGLSDLFPAAYQRAADFGGGADVRL